MEWSGILLYKFVGSIKEPEKAKIILKDIIPMNKGNQTYTEYNFNEKKRDTSGYEDRMIDYFNDNPEALEDDWLVGHIHSHNSMNVFFSGTDMSELEDNSECHNFYLSLIVNNWMDFCAKVAFRGGVKVSVEQPYMALDENGQEYQMFKQSVSKFTAKKEKLFIHDCDIEVDSEEKLKVNTTFAGSVNAIIKKAEEAKKVTTTTYSGFGTGTANKAINTQNGNTQKSGVPVITQPKITGFTKAEQKSTDIAKDIVKDIPFADLMNMDLDREEGLTDVEEFLVFILTGTTDPLSYPDVETAFMEVEAMEMPSTDVSKSVIEVYPAAFEKYFDEEKDDFVAITEEVIEVLEEYESTYTFTSNTIMALKYMVLKFEEYGDSSTAVGAAQ